MAYDDPRCAPAGKRRCEIDRLISRELGGTDEIKNLWPQAYGTSPWNGDQCYRALLHWKQGDPDVFINQSWGLYYDCSFYTC